jgi:hypothetical protein
MAYLFFRIADFTYTIMKENTQTFMFRIKWRNHYDYYLYSWYCVMRYYLYWLLLTETDHALLKYIEYDFSRGFYIVYNEDQ